MLKSRGGLSALPSACVQHSLRVEGSALVVVSVFHSHGNRMWEFILGRHFPQALCCLISPEFRGFSAGAYEASRPTCCRGASAPVDITGAHPQSHQDEKSIIISWSICRRPSWYVCLVSTTDPLDAIATSRKCTKNQVQRHLAHNFVNCAGFLDLGSLATYLGILSTIVCCPTSTWFNTTAVELLTAYA